MITFLKKRNQGKFVIDYIVDRMADKIIAEYGKINHKLRKLKLLDQSRLKLIQSISNELNDLKLNSENTRFVYDITSSTTKPFSNESITKSSASSSDNNTAIDYVLSYLESNIMTLHANCKLTNEHIHEISSSMNYDALFNELSKDLPQPPLPSTTSHTNGTTTTPCNMRSDIDSVAPIQDLLSTDKYFADLLNDPTFRDLQCQYSTSNNTNDQELNEAKQQLNQIRNKHKDILNKLIVTCEPLSPYQIKLT